MVKQIVFFFISWKIIIFIFALRAISLLKFNLPAGFSLDYWQASPYLGVWANFDGASYLNISRSGYSYPNFAYFPLLPFLISVFHKLTSLPFLESGLLVVHLSFFASLFVFYKTVLLDFEKKIARRALILLLVFPLSFFYGAVYTESLYFLLATLSFYFARKSHWFLAGIFGFLTGLSRLVGISLFAALLLEWFIQNRKQSFVKDKVFFLFLIPLALIAYGLYLQMNFADFFLFQKSMANWGQANFIFPLQTLLRYGKIIVFASKNLVYFIAILELFSTILYFLLSFYVLKKIRLSYGVWMFVSLLIPTFTGTLQSMPRYLLHLFPAFIAMALIFKDKKAFRLAVISFLILQFILVALFTRGYFVA